MRMKKRRKSLRSGKGTIFLGIKTSIKFMNITKTYSLTKEMKPNTGKWFGKKTFTRNMRS
jgi:hypothetical protein